MLVFLETGQSPDEAANFITDPIRNANSRPRPTAIWHFTKLHNLLNNTFLDKFFIANNTYQHQIHIDSLNFKKKFKNKDLEYRTSANAR
jgi:hypothetical protein